MGKKEDRGGGGSFTTMEDFLKVNYIKFNCTLRLQCIQIFSSSIPIIVMSYFCFIGFLRAAPRMGLKLLQSLIDKLIMVTSTYSDTRKRIYIWSTTCQQLCRKSGRYHVVYCVEDLLKISTFAICGEQIFLYYGHCIIICMACVYVPCALLSGATVGNYY